MKKILIVSGKGGTGKSVVAANLCASLAESEHKVLLVDADLALASQDVMLGVEIGCSIGHLLRDQREFRDAVHATRWGFDLVSGGSGWPELSALDVSLVQTYVGQADGFASDYGYVVADGPAGVGAGLVPWVQWAQEVVVVATPDALGLLGAYSAIQFAWTHNPGATVWIVVNHAGSEAHGEKVAEQLRTIVGQYLSRDAKYLGCVRDDKAVRVSVDARVPVVAHRPKCNASVDLSHLAWMISDGGSGAETAPAESAVESSESLLEKIKANYSSASESEAA